MGARWSYRAGLLRGNQLLGHQSSMVMIHALTAKESIKVCVVNLPVAIGVEGPEQPIG